MDYEMRQFVRLVKEMRFYQKKYFRSRAPDALEMARELEIQVDKCIKELTESPVNQQMTMDMLWQQR